jgi:hypothetical protein
MEITRRRSLRRLVAAALSAWLVFRDPSEWRSPHQTSPLTRVGISRAMRAKGTIDWCDLTDWTLPLAPWRGIDAVRGGHSAQPYCGTAARPPTAQSRGGIAPASRRAPRGRVDGRTTRWCGRTDDRHLDRPSPRRPEPSQTGRIEDLLRPATARVTRGPEGAVAMPDDDRSKKRNPGRPTDAQSTHRSLIAARHERLRLPVVMPVSLPPPRSQRYGANGPIGYPNLPPAPDRPGSGSRPLSGRADPAKARPLASASPLTGCGTFSQSTRVREDEETA